MNIFELIKNRESCREYSDKEVSLEKLIEIVDAARMAPSAANTQVWNFYIIKGSEAVKKTAEGCMAMERNGFAAEVNAFIVMTRDVEAETWVPATPYNHYYRDFDCGIAAAHICFAATELGLSTCMLGWFDEEPIKEVCGYDDTERASVVFTVGYARSDTLREKKRFTVEEILTII